jgi:hypothetical protein
MVPGAESNPMTARIEDLSLRYHRHPGRRIFADFYMLSEKQCQEIRSLMAISADL